MGRISTPKTQLAGEFNMKDLGAVTNAQDEGTIGEKEQEGSAFTKRLCGEGSATLQHAKHKASFYPVLFI